MAAGNAYTGLRRRKQTSWAVKFGDAFVSRIIAVGGIGTIVAILLVVIVLLGTALPLFKSPEIQAWHLLPSVEMESQAPGDDVDNSNMSTAYEHFGVDENGLLLWGMLPSGEIQTRSILDGRILETASPELPQGVSITCTDLSIDRTNLSIGLSDGTFRVADVGFDVQLMGMRDLPSEIQVTQERPVQVLDSAVYRWFDAQGVRKTVLREIVWSEPRKLGDGPVNALDYLQNESFSLLSTRSTTHALAVVGDQLVFAKIETKQDRIRRKTTETVSTESCALQIRSADARPLHITLLNGTDHALVVWSHGTIDRYSLISGAPVLSESQAVAVNRTITAATPLLARENLLCGLDDGLLQGWMVRPIAENEKKNGNAIDGFQLIAAHEIQIGDRPIHSISSNRLSHVAVVCDDRNMLSMVYVTTDRVLKREKYPFDQEIRSLAFGPDGETLVAASSNSQAISEIDIGHPEASFRTYFGKVWYAGHNEPKYIWQSSAATAQSEIKLSLMPLVFGTFKATLYAMLISVPLAILTAIYTSEFLSSSIRGRVKPVIEMMASLPSVVLGYIAAIVLAPFLQAHLLAVLLGLLILPLTFVLAGNLWNLLPVEKLVRYQSFRLVGLLACVPFAAFVTFAIATLCESWLFGGDLIAWLSNREGDARGGWMLLLLPLLSLTVCLLMLGPMANWNRAVAMKRTPRAYAIFCLMRIAISVAGVILLSWLSGSLLGGLGFDLRGQLFDSYQDRNALLVGFALGFCVIPIVYTISDDALQSVPKQLRSASLGCGATPWQTTMRVVVPSAMSGLFSAVMIGLGRAVGETMVVLCAAGNTPLMEWNPFNGFKTLSAALATELPEAAKGSTHFRTLFLAAVLLFFMTLIVNTLAEFVRIRFRKRSSQL